MTGVTGPARTPHPPVSTTVSPEPDTKDLDGKPDGETAHWYPQGISASVDGYGGTVGGNRKHHLSIDDRVVRRDPGAKGFKVIPRRWTVQRSFGRLMQRRRLTRDYDTQPHRTETVICLAIIDLMSRRLTADSNPNWRGTWTGTERKPADG
ncbi:hypothetical protein ACSNOH_01210 [Streptomyces sp. URMC 127]|uniref:hypothetical protein n=1 Tax=Streptomyces sp. URMC 127 TaxID=3423402 RepID=UPI003F1CC80B